MLATDDVVRLRVVVGPMERVRTGTDRYRELWHLDSVFTPQGALCRSGNRTAVTWPLTSYFDEVYVLRTNSVRDFPEVMKDATSDPCERHVPPLRSMEETLHGTSWSLIGPLLTTDDAVRCRTTASHWNVGCRCREDIKMQVHSNSGGGDVAVATKVVICNPSYMNLAKIKVMGKVVRYTNIHEAPISRAAERGRQID